MERITRDVLGVFQTRAHAEEVVNHFRRMGYGNQDLSLMMNHGTGLNLSLNRGEAVKEHLYLSGIEAGGMLGIVIAGLIVTGMLRVHALNPFLVLGFPSALYAGFFTGAVLGGIVGVLIDFVVKRDANIHHDDELREGDAVVVVHAWDNESVKEISTILNDSHAKLITIVKNSNFYSTDPATSEPGENTTMSNVRNKVQEKTEQNAYLLDKAKNAENDLLRKSSGIPASIPDQLDEVLLKRSKEIGSWIGKTGVRIKAFGETLHQIGEGISHLHERLKSDQKERSSSDSTPEKDFH